MTIPAELIRNVADLINDVDDLQDQIYIVAGVLGGVCGFLLIIIIVLAIKLNTVSKKISNTSTSINNGIKRNLGALQDTHDGPIGNNSSRNELAQRGWSEYHGNPPNPRNADTVKSQVLNSYKNVGNGNPGVKVLPSRPAPMHRQY